MSEFVCCPWTGKEYPGKRLFAAAFDALTLPDEKKEKEGRKKIKKSGKKIEEKKRRRKKR